MGVGGAICSSFIVLGALSVVCYKPWRRWVERGRRGAGSGEVVKLEGERAGREEMGMNAENHGLMREREVKDGMQGFDAIESVPTVPLVEAAE